MDIKSRNHSLNTNKQHNETIRTTNEAISFHLQHIEKDCWTLFITNPIHNTVNATLLTIGVSNDVLIAQLIALRSVINQSHGSAKLLNFTLCSPSLLLSEFNEIIIHSISTISTICRERLTTLLLKNDAFYFCFSS